MKMKWLILWIISLTGLIGAGVFRLLNFWALFGGVIIWLGIATFLVIYFWLAPTNRWFTFVKEGTAKIVVRGDKFEKALIQWEGRTFEYTAKSAERWLVVEENEKRKEPWHPLGGFRFYGFWPILDIYIYNFKWSGVTEDSQVVHHPKEPMDYILVRDDVFWAKVEEAEDINLLPLTIELVLTIRIVNPYKALFNIQNWLETVINRIKPTVRDVTTQKEYKEWIGQPEAMGETIYQRAEETLKEFRETYGVDVRKIQVKKIDPPPDYRRETLAPYLAELERQATVTKAEGEKQRIKRVFAQIKQFGDLGKLVRTLEAAERSPLAASLTIQAIPGLQEVLRGVFGKPTETVTREEFAELRGLVEDALKRR